MISGFWDVGDVGFCGFGSLGCLDVVVLCLCDVFVFDFFVFLDVGILGF